MFSLVLHKTQIDLPIFLLQHTILLELADANVKCTVDLALRQLLHWKKSKLCRKYIVNKYKVCSAAFFATLTLINIMSNVFGRKRQREITCRF